VNYSADYYRLDFSVGFNSFTPYIGYEVLDGDDTQSGAAFRTPLATLHASISRKFADHYAFLLKGAWFDGDSESAYDDTTKIRVQFTANF
jgi:hypothetical protein